MVVNDRQERVRRAAALDIKPSSIGPVILRHAFGEEYVHLTWGHNLGLVGDSTVALPLYTLINRYSVRQHLKSQRLQVKVEGLDSFKTMEIDMLYGLSEYRRGLTSVLDGGGWEKLPRTDRSLTLGEGTADRKATWRLTRHG